MKALLLLLFVPSLLFAQSSYQYCGIQSYCAEFEQAKKNQEMKVQKAQEETNFRQEQIQLEEAQLQELKDQRALLQDELTQMNDSQLRTEDLQQQELDRTPELPSKGNNEEIEDESAAVE